MITGAAGGLGRSHAVLLAQQGADVVVHDMDADGADETADAVRAAGSKAHVIAMDIRNTTELISAIDEAAARLGTVDILVNNAGIGGQGLALADVTEETFDHVFDVHVKAAFFVTQAVAPGMRRQRYGKIINTTSVFAMGGSSFASHYAAAKSALTGLTQSWARELAPYNIMVNAVAPGIVETEMTLNSVGQAGIRALAKDIPLGRMAQPLEISYAVAWLASPETDMLTGQVISPNGGANMAPTVIQ